MKSEPPTCEGCIFYHIDCDEIGACGIYENIVEATQEACNDFGPINRPYYEND